MNLYPSSILRSASQLTVACFLCGSALAQDAFTASDVSVSTSLTVMSGDDFTAESLILGDGAILAAGGDFALEATVTPLSVTILADKVEVFLAVEGDNLVLAWPESGAGYVLESTAALGDAPNWQPVSPGPAERRFVTPLTQPAVFFRLRRP